jgi:ribosomal-protein-alanine N-acetyltransferase
MSSGNNALHNRPFNYVELTGPKVRVRSTRSQDAAVAFPLIHKREPILRWLYWEGPANSQELAFTFGRRWPADLRAGRSYHFAIEESRQPGIIGCIGARLERHPQQFDIGYWLAEEYWGRGYVSEALGLICHLCFEHLGAEVIHAGAFYGNQGSLRVQQKNGFVLDGTLRRYALKNGDWIDLWHSSLLKAEWPAHAVTPLAEKLEPFVTFGERIRRLLKRSDTLEAKGIPWSKIKK